MRIMIMLIATDMSWTVLAWFPIMIMFFAVAMFGINMTLLKVGLIQKKTQRLEQELGVATQLIQLLAGQLQVVGGVGALGPEMTRVLASCDEKQVQGIIQR